MAQQWYSIVEYARVFSISDMTVRRRIKTGKLNAVLKEGKYYIPVDDRSMLEPSINRSMPEPMPSPVKREPVVHRPETMQQSTYSDRGNFSYRNPTNSTQEAREFASKNYSDQRPKVVANHIPNSVMRPVERAESLVLRADHLIKFCDEMLGELHESKNQNRDLYTAKIKTLEAKLAAKEVELQQFAQQVEDLQVLVKILETKNGS